ncbi:MAG: O-acetylhomoserine aminocarboxypropyltransferase/cysteine synthase family protein [Halarsenatibacteraceae bacterium]
MTEKWKKSTKAVRSGYQPEVGDPQVLPSVQSTTYNYDDPEKLADIFDLKAEGHIYSGSSNPTVAAFAEKINDLEGGVGALATSSGQAATTLALLNICQQGQHILAISNLYGGTYTLLSSTLKKYGIDVTFVDPASSIEEIVAEARPETRAVFAETISNPSLNVLDFDKFSSVSEEIAVPLIVDNTFPTPILCNPLEHGADIVLHSATKYIDGHARAVGGVIVAGGSFNWANGKYPELTEADPTYNGVRYVERFGEEAYIVKARANLLRDFGATLSPFNAFLLNQGSETLELRMERHRSNTQELAEYLVGHDKVSWVNYPGLESSDKYHLTEKYLPDGASGILTLGVEGGIKSANKLIGSFDLTSLVTHVGDNRTSILHPATTTHKQLSKKELKESGVSEDMLRVSVGIENIEDIIADFDQALAKI